MLRNRWMGVGLAILLGGSVSAQAPNTSGVSPSQPAETVQARRLPTGAKLESNSPKIKISEEVKSSGERVMKIEYQPAPPNAGAPAESAPKAETAPLTDELQSEEPPKLGPTAPEDVSLLTDNTLAGDWIRQSGVRAFGWMDVGYTYNSTGAGEIGVQPRPNRFGNEFTVNQLYLAIEKPLNQDDLNFGFRTDFFAGSDASLLEPVGAAVKVKPTSRFGFDVRQLYASAHVPILTDGGVDLKFGRQNTVIGYESYAAPYRPFYSNDYQWFYSENGGDVWTGISANWHVTKKLDFYNGLTQGYNTFFTNRSGGPTWISQLNYWLQEEKETLLTGTLVVGPEQRAFVSTSNIRTVIELRIQENWTERFTQIIQSHMGWEQDVPGLGNSQWYGLMTILMFHNSCELDTNFRVEWFDDVQGANTGFRTSYAEVTLGFDYHPVNALSLRPEVRGDFSENPAFRNGRDRAQLTVAMDAVIKF